MYSAKIFTSVFLVGKFLLVPANTCTCCRLMCRRYPCLYGQAPRYLADHLIPASNAAPLSLSHSRSGGRVRVTAPIVSRKFMMRRGSVESMWLVEVEVRACVWAGQHRSTAPRRGRLGSANRNSLTGPRCRLSTYGCRAFDYAGPTVWNSLPDELRNSDSFYSLKRFMKTILFSRYYSVCSRSSALARTC